MSIHRTLRPEVPTLQELVMLPPFGGEVGGYSTEGDILPRVTQTLDNVDLNVIWQEMQEALGKWNQERSKIVDLVSYWHTSPADAVPQGLIESELELVSEFGEPESMGPPSEYLLLGYTMLDWDRAARFTWRFLRDADARQVRAVLDEAMRSDNTTVTRRILNRLFNPSAELNEQGHTCYGLWNGTDGLALRLLWARRSTPITRTTSPQETMQSTPVILRWRLSTSASMAMV